ncbi:GNAT family N-acetyltransferase [Bowmanella yangjiangensis]|uniref:GNAT family N-acetyltransferase n=1 Tax=Bowmanella yangjiangensis TaxID=2811230 RepID=UPI001E3E127D|nr:GNAT family N-acetyltransferase [Bowmanella yangjiangensis]
MVATGRAGHSAGLCQGVNWRRLDPIRQLAGAELQKIYFLSGTTGRGYGKAMLSEVVEEARRREEPFVWLDVLKSNIQGERFYTRERFKCLGELSFQTDLQDIGIKVMALPL